MQIVECASRIEHVCMYARGATVRRRIELGEELPADACELRLSGITAQAEAGSLRVEVEGSRQVVGLRTRLVAPAGPPPPVDLSARRRALALEKHKLQIERKHLSRRRQALSETNPELRLGRKGESTLR